MSKKQKGESTESNEFFDVGLSKTVSDLFLNPNGLLDKVDKEQNKGKKPKGTK